jgi:hypothetical protein
VPGPTPIPPISHEDFFAALDRFLRRGLSFAVAAQFDTDEVRRLRPVLKLPFADQLLQELLGEAAPSTQAGAVMAEGRTPEPRKHDAPRIVGAPHPEEIDPLKELLSRVAEGNMPIAAAVGRLTESHDGREAQKLPASSPTAATAEFVLSSGSPETNTKLHRVWFEVLGYDQFDASQNFFDLGGSSVSALKLLRLIEEHCCVRMEVAEIYGNPTFAAMASRIDALAPRAQ